MDPWKILVLSSNPSALFCSLFFSLFSFFAEKSQWHFMWARAFFITQAQGPKEPAPLFSLFLLLALSVPFSFLLFSVIMRLVIRKPSPSFMVAFLRSSAHCARSHLQTQKWKERRLMKRNTINGHALLVSTFNFVRSAFVTRNNTKEGRRSKKDIP